MGAIKRMANNIIDKAAYAGINLLAAYTGAQAFVQRVFEDPKAAHQTQLYQQRIAAFDLLWSYYNSSLFDKAYNSITGLPSNYGQMYKQNYNLYRNIRLIYNPVRRLVDFYGAQIYPGVLSEDGAGLPDGVPLAVPFSEDTPLALKDAVAQFWAWTNWQAKKTVQIRYGAALGSTMIELIDDPERGQITADVVWPGFITYLELDPAGNVKLYVMDYQAFDPLTGPYFYRKIVTREVINYYKNFEPFDYDGLGAERANPYGFVPAVWIKHLDVGGTFGSPAVAGSLAKIDELNSLASHVHDQVHKVIGSPLIMWTDGSIDSLTKKVDRGSTSDQSTPVDDQQALLLLKGPKEGRVDSLAGQLNLADAAHYMTMLMSEIEQDHPELVYYREMRSMSQVTGPAAARLVGDVASRVSEAAANYDAGNISLFRMAVAMGGYRANAGDWGTLNKQQQKFLPFNLDSYENGNLDMAIMPRALLTPTKAEQASERMNLWLGVQAASSAGVPLTFALREEGFTEEELTQLGQDKAAEQAASPPPQQPSTGKEGETGVQPTQAPA